MTATQPPIPPLPEFLRCCQQRVERTLGDYLAVLSARGELKRAMTYATLSGGKRVRPVLAYGAALAAGGDMAGADRPAAAVELIHCYSLVHDDLPAMDDDDLRRGQPTVHKAFGEATAILVGDALQSLAFQVLGDATAGGLDPATCVAMVSVLARAAGGDGMAGGQMLDFEAVGRSLDLEQLQKMHDLKTGALIRASVELGALSVPGVAPEQLARLRAYADHVGLAFQVQDDILDVTADTATLGKRQGSDQARKKPTYTSLLGLDTAREKARRLASDAVNALDTFPAAADPLRQLARYIVERAH